MFEQISAKWSVFIFSLVGLVLCFLIVLLLNFDRAPSQSSFTKIVSPTNSQDVQVLLNGQPVEPTKVALLPFRLKIPKINVDAALESVGLTPAGNMGIPRSIDNAAWFKLGPRPGEPGNAVLAGHFGWQNGKPAVFENLNKLQPGDKLLIENDKGTTISFIVRATQIYDPAINNEAVFNSIDEGTHLNLITCEGVWDEAQKSYSNRLVVFADKE